MNSTHHARPGPVACIAYAGTPAPGAVTAALFRQGFTVVERPYTRALGQLLDEVEPDALIAVVRPDKPEGLSLVRFLEGHLPASPVIVLCADPADGDQDRITALEAGALVALPVSTNPAVIGAQVAALVRRTAAAPPPLDSRVVVRDLTIDFGRRTVARRGRQVDLTRSEFDILAHLYRNAGRVLSPAEIMTGIGQTAPSPAHARGVVKVHVSHLRSKLGASDKGEYVVTVRGVGYLFEKLMPPEDSPEGAGGAAMAAL